MSTHSTALVRSPTGAPAITGHASLEARRFDQWIGEIEDHIGDVEGHIRELALAGEDTGPESFNLQKMQLLLEIAREAKTRV